MNTRPSVLLSVGLLAFGLAGCTTGEANTTPDSGMEAPASEAMPEAMSGDHMMASPEGDGPRMATSTGGSHVTLVVTPNHVVAGPMSLEISVHSSDGSAIASSVDLASPSMPMHGVVRYPVTDGKVDFEIPMEGDWVVYVNLDGTGNDAAEFVFQVAPNSEGGHVH